MGFSLYIRGKMAVSITVKVNEQDVNTKAETLKDLLIELGETPEQIIVELNGQVITNKKIAIVHGDKITHMRWMAGG